MKHFKLFITLFILAVVISCGQQKKYTTYKVKKGETMRVIAKKLDIKTKDLLHLNPDIGRRPKANTTIIIPNKAAFTDDKKDDTIVENPIENDMIKIIDTVDNLKDKYILHTVNKGDTFYSLTRYYNVSEADLLALNLGLEEGLKLGNIIKIKKLVEGENLDKIYEDIISDDASVKIGLLLPFKAKLFDTIASQEIFRNKKLINIVTDFYLGAEIAIDSLKNQGIEIQLTVFDTEDRNTKVNEIISDNSLEGMDAVIGPLYSDETKKVADNINIPVVFPLFSKVQTSFSSSGIIKTAPDKKLYKEKLLSYISEKYNGENIIIVGDSTYVSMIEINQITSILTQHYSINFVQKIIPSNGYIEKERFLQILKREVTNFVVIATENTVIASDVINSLISFPEDVEFKVKVFAFEKGEGFNNIIDNNKLAKIGFTYVTDTYIDESSTAAKTFDKQYLTKNNALPSYYSTRGFDVMYDVIIRLASENTLYDTFKEGVSYRLGSKFDFQKRIFSPTENNGLFLLEYNTDLSLTRLR